MPTCRKFELKPKQPKQPNNPTNPTTQVFQKLLLLIFLLLTITQNANAYWLESTTEPFSLREREHAPPAEGKMFFTIQDNFELFTDKIDSAPLLLPHSDYFVPADIIDINLPLFGIFSHPAKPVEDPIANLLYANLKIKKILDEYAEIQKRAAELLQDQSTNFPEGKMLVTDDESAENLKGNKEKDSSIYEKLLQKLISLSASNLSEVDTRDAEQKNNSQSSPVQATLLSFQHLQKKTKSPLQAAQLNSNISQGTGKIAAADYQSQPSSQYSQQSASTRTQDQSNPYAGEITLPWVLELPFKLFNYLLSHKIQALFITLFGLMIINIIFGSRH